MVKLVPPCSPSPAPLKSVPGDCSDSYRRACSLGSMPPGPHPRALARPQGYNPERPGNKQQYLRCRRWRCPCRSAAWPPGRSERNKGICSFFCWLCSLFSGRRRNSILSYAPDHLTFSPQRFLTAAILPRLSRQVRYIYLHSFLIRHEQDISETLTPSKAPTLAMRGQYIRRQLIMQPPLFSIRQEATAALHRARSHSCAAQGIGGQEATAAQHRARSHCRAVRHLQRSVVATIRPFSGSPSPARSGRCPAAAILSLNLTAVLHAPTVHGWALLIIPCPAQVSAVSSIWE